MVSGFVTSPCDQERMVSGEASDSLRASKFSSFSTVFPPVSFRSLRKRSPGSLARRVLAELLAFQVDAQVERELGDVLLAQHDLTLVLAQDLDPQGQALELLDQYPEALRDPCFEPVVTLDDGLVGLDAAHDVVGLHGQDLLEHVG